MKKFLIIIILSVFVLSIMGSVSPKVKSYVENFTGDTRYASTMLPAPPDIQLNNDLAKN